MADQPPPSSSPPPPAGGSAVSYGLVFLTGVAVALIGYRCFLDKRGTHPTDIVRTSTGSPSDSKKEYGEKPPPSRRFDLNKAERHELLQLPGVGPAMADKILAFRDAKGPFQRIDDLREVQGIGEKTLQKFKPWLMLDEPEDQPQRLSRKAPEPIKTSANKKPLPSEPLDLNTATAADFARLPGIGPTLSQSIVAERDRKPFASVDDLRRVSGIGVKRLEQIKPYVMVVEKTGR